MMSEPVRVSWLGFTSDTLTLHRAGWTFSAHQDVRNRTMQLAMRHDKGRMTALSVVTDWNYERNIYGFPRPEFPIIFLRHLAENLVVHMMGEVRADRFRPIDPVPVYREGRTVNLEDLAHFAPINFKRIILPEETVPELMARILEVQQPARDEYFRDQAKKARVHAQLVSISS